ncbi:MAG: hypothetical protein LAP87_04650 [Acidobacteriia bacterium]|nr:hypothetical protein [Terriglobia bacterium]
MQVAPNELRQYYSSLSDEMLLEIDPADLTDAARQCYQSEFAKRGLSPDAAPPPAADEHAEAGLEVEPDWLEHAACPCSFTSVPGSNHAPDAERAREVLLAAGIPCHLSAISPDPRNEDSPRFEEYRVLVPASLNLKAISVLDQEIFNADLEADWRTHFADLPDEDLRALHPEVICAGLLDRVERLTRAYNDEIARRRAERA